MRNLMYAAMLLSPTDDSSGGKPAAPAAPAAPAPAAPAPASVGTLDELDDQELADLEPEPRTRAPLTVRPDAKPSGWQQPTPDSNPFARMLREKHKRVTDERNTDGWAQRIAAYAYPIRETLSPDECDLFEKAEHAQCNAAELTELLRLFQFKIEPLYMANGVFPRHGGPGTKIHTPLRLIS